MGYQVQLQSVHIKRGHMFHKVHGHAVSQVMLVVHVAKHGLRVQITAACKSWSESVMWLSAATAVNVQFGEAHTLEGP